MKKILSILFLMVLLNEGITQPSNHISGIIRDSTTRHSLAYVTVHLVADSNTVIKTTFSDSTGVYLMTSVSPGNYVLSFSLAGYAAGRSSSFAVYDSSQLNTGEHLLSTQTKQLSGITILARKPLIEKLADGIVYNVQQDLQAGGGTAIDVLRKTPMVSLGGTTVFLI